MTNMFNRPQGLWRVVYVKKKSNVSAVLDCLVFNSNNLNSTWEIIFTWNQRCIILDFKKQTSGSNYNDNVQ